MSPCGKYDEAVYLSPITFDGSLFNLRLILASNFAKVLDNRKFLDNRSIFNNLNLTVLTRFFEIVYVLIFVT